MTTFNLTEDSQQIKISKFPDGQQQVDIGSLECGVSVNQPVKIKSRLNNWRDLELIVCTNQSLRNIGFRKIHLFISYFCGARSDRKFGSYGNNYLKQVICPVINLQGFDSVTVLDPHIGAIYGDSITPERAENICQRLKEKGFASTNIVLGIGSYTYQHNTRDTLGFAMKATYGEVNGVGREIFKDPITDDGTKRSKKGLLCVTYDDFMNIVCADQCSWTEEKTGLLETVFCDGKLVKETTLEEIRERLKNSELKTSQTY